MQEPGLLLGESQLVFAAWVGQGHGLAADLASLGPGVSVTENNKGSARSSPVWGPCPRPHPLLAAPSQPAPPWSSSEGLGEGLCAFLLGLCQLSPLQGLGARQLGAGLC